MKKIETTEERLGYGRFDCGKSDGDVDECEESGLPQMHDEDAAFDFNASNTIVDYGYLSSLPTNMTQQSLWNPEELDRWMEGYNMPADGEDLVTINGRV